MESITKIKLSNNVFQFVQARTKQLGFASKEDYIIDLIRSDQTSQERLELLLLEGLDSGEPIEVTSAHLDDLKTRLQKRVQKHN